MGSQGIFLGQTPGFVQQHRPFVGPQGQQAGQRLLPEGWVAGSTAISATYRAGATSDDKNPNGWMWWLNQAPREGFEPPWPDAPLDAYSAIGHWGQYVVVVPSRDVVIVRTGDDRDDGISLNQLISLSLKVAQ